MVSSLDSVEARAVRRAEEELRLALTKIRGRTEADRSADLLVRVDDDVEAMRNSLVSLRPGMPGLEPDEVSIIYGDLQDHVSSLSEVLLTHSWPDRRERNQVRDLLDESLTRLLGESWLLEAGQNLRDYLSMDVGLMLSIAACRGRLSTDPLPPSLLPWQIHNFAAALEEVYASGDIPFGWIGVFPDEGAPRRARWGG